MITNAFLNWLALRCRRRHNLGRQRYFWASVNLSFPWVQVTIPVNVKKSTRWSKYVATTTCSTGSELRLRRKRKLRSYAGWFKPAKPRRRKEESPTETLYLRHQQVSPLRMSLFSKESTNNSVSPHYVTSWLGKWHAFPCYLASHPKFTRITIMITSPCCDSAFNFCIYFAYIVPHWNCDPKLDDFKNENKTDGLLEPYCFAVPALAFLLTLS